MTCHACHEPVGGPVCVGCGALQAPPVDPDPFAILGLSRRYHLAPTEVEARYLKVARTIHPDKFVSRPSRDKQAALQWTAAVNEARRTLKDPVARARYLATGSARQDERGPSLDGAFLQQMFEWREAEEEAPGSMAAHAVALQVELEAEIDQIFSRWEGGGGALDAVPDRLARLKYVTGLLRPAGE
ncbi:MAG: Fe-S protein assembly co-chaperone HscB [Deltaproteobacteria bacterium]|nr:Fe-S protein assembly co-chaperone HscB [Deltaproteobacteria bacterium]